MRAQRWPSPADMEGAIEQGAIDLRGAQWPPGFGQGPATGDPWSDTYKDDEFVVSTDPFGVTIAQPSTETRIRAAEADPQQLTEQAKFGGGSTVQIAYELVPPQNGKPGEVVLVVGPGAVVEIQRPPPQDVRAQYGQMQVIEELRRFVPVPESALEGRSITSDFGGFDLTVIEMPDNSLVPPQFQPLDVPVLLQVPGVTVRGPDKEIWTGTLSRQQEFIEKWTLIGSLAFAAVPFAVELALAVRAASMIAEAAAPLAGVASEAATAPVVAATTDEAASVAGVAANDVTPLAGLEMEGAAPLTPTELVGPEVEPAGLEAPLEQPRVEGVPPEEVQATVEAPRAPPRPASWPLRKMQELVFRGALQGTRAAEVLPEFEDVAGLVETQSGGAAVVQTPEAVGSEALTSQVPQPAAPATVQPLAAVAAQPIVSMAGAGFAGTAGGIAGAGVSSVIQPGSAGSAWDYARFPRVSRRWQLGDPIDMPSSAGEYPTFDTARTRYWRNRAYAELAARARGQVSQDLLNRSDPLRSMSDAELRTMEANGNAPRDPASGRTMELEHFGVPQRVETWLRELGFTPSEARRLAQVANPQALLEVSPVEHAFFDAKAWGFGSQRADVSGARWTGTQDADVRLQRPLYYMSDDAIRDIVQRAASNPTAYDFGKNAATQSLRNALRAEIAARNVPLTPP